MTVLSVPVLRDGHPLRIQQRLRALLRYFKLGKEGLCPSLARPGDRLWALPSDSSEASAWTSSPLEKTKS